MYKIYYKKLKNDSATIIEKFKRGCWIYVQSPTDDELAFLGENYELDVDLLKDGVDPDESPRIEIEDGIMYVYSKYLYTAGKNIQSNTVLVVIAPNFILTLVNSSENPLLDFINNKQSVNTTQQMNFLIQTFLKINQTYKSHVHKLSKEINNIGNNIEKIDNKEILRFAEIEKLLNEFLTALIPTKLIFERILYDKKIKLYQDDEDLVEDLSLGNGQLIEITKSTIKYITNLREAYSAILTNKLNKTMKVLTSITVILTIPTMIASFFGMNVQIPGQEFMHSFTIILGSTFLMSLALLYLFSKKDLL